ncbi:uncharacterized protein PV06_07460 [Exophiala oligosperma]|uniref:OTU domain-containing protein n=1 Tax=Exophiala oligosperma TaxID=215243 RepID=A0A0D2DAV8_9EURO|nr:uncharacterized protein PV06_07460 [Exophiala oligosperma]KIW40248.1 hypothetical protein PV06_07460 [Exophiala oligosperma]
MADHAFSTQLPSMVRKPKAVWPGLVKMGMYQKQIAGDGNCLFASLSDQLYGTPAKHPEIRASIIDHMRTCRPVFEHYVHKDDVQQRRTLRSAANAVRQEPEDAFEAYLSLMSRPGTYGGEPELVAFCQVFDQDVTVHLPRIQNFNRDSISYTNEHRYNTSIAAPLHICYGGDEVTRAHYDSARSRDGSTPRSRNSPLLRPQDAPRNSISGTLSSSPVSSLTSRAIRNSRAELSSELIQDFLQKSKKETEINLDQLNDKYRARSPSVTSSQRSSSSKRSLDDDGEPIRSNKRADRRKSARKRGDIAVTIPDPDGELSPRLLVESPGPDTPLSTQDTDVSSDAPLQERPTTTVKAMPVVLDDDHSNYKHVSRSTKQASQQQARPSVHVLKHRPQPSESSSPRMISVAERPKSTLRA